MQGCRAARAGTSAWNKCWVGTLEKVLGNFTGSVCLGKVLARLLMRLLHGPGWEWCLEIALG